VNHHNWLLDWDGVSLAFCLVSAFLNFNAPFIVNYDCSASHPYTQRFPQCLHIWKYHTKHH
jgi:hypothetical protein